MIWGRTSLYYMVRRPAESRLLAIKLFCEKTLKQLVDGAKQFRRRSNVEVFYSNVWTVNVLPSPGGANLIAWQMCRPRERSVMSRLTSSVTILQLDSLPVRIFRSRLLINVGSPLSNYQVPCRPVNSIPEIKAQICVIFEDRQTEGDSDAWSFCFPKNEHCLWTATIWG